MRHEETVGLRERKKAEMKKRLVDAAIELYLEQGYGETRIEDITAAANVSRRTFFHYFTGKDDVVTGRFAQQAEFMRETFVARPAEESTWDSLREACHMLFVTYGVNRERAERLRVLMHTEPALFARKYDFYLRAQAELIPVVQRRLGRRAGGAMVAGVLVRAALAAQDAAAEARARSKDRATPRKMLERAFALARPAAEEEAV